MGSRTNPFRHWWRSSPAVIRAALVGGVCVISAALIPLFGVLMNRALVSKAGLSVVDAGFVLTPDSLPAIEFVLRNSRTYPELVHSASISFYFMAPAPASTEATTYVLSVTSVREQRIAGFAQEIADSAGAPSVFYPFSGNYHQASGFNILTLNVPVRVVVPALGYAVVRFVIPDTMQVVEVHESPLWFVRYLRVAPRTFRVRDTALRDEFAHIRATFYYRENSACRFARRIYVRNE